MNKHIFTFAVGTIFGMQSIKISETQRCNRYDSNFCLQLPDKSEIFFSNPDFIPYFRNIKSNVKIDDRRYYYVAKFLDA